MPTDPAPGLRLVHYRIMGPILERLDVMHPIHNHKCPWRITVTYCWPGAQVYHQVQYFAGPRLAMRAIAHHRRDARAAAMDTLADSLFDPDREAARHGH